MLWLVRHAQPLLPPGLCYGALDIPADAVLTQSAAHRLAAVLPRNVPVRVLASPLQRCVQLAECLHGLRPDLPFATDVRLQEMDFGIWEGVPWPDIPRAAVDEWVANFATHRFGGKESAHDVMQRVAAVWDEMHRAQTACASPRCHALWITHKGIAQATMLLSQGQRRVQQAADWPTVRLDYGGWRCLALQR
ncbi:MAG: histidine phosphatase family protein [Rhodoferax sp.]|nr:histidine phosphatase family protein [Rhodoferax sp.]